MKCNKQDRESLPFRSGAIYRVRGIAPQAAPTQRDKSLHYEQHDIQKSYMVYRKKDTYDRNHSF
jgi:hypothetical protein